MGVQSACHIEMGEGIFGIEQIITAVATAMKTTQVAPLDIREVDFLVLI